MERRQFVGLASGGLLAGPIVARAQTAIPVIGYLSGRSADSEAPIREPFLKSPEVAGFAAGRNIAIEYRYAQGREWYEVVTRIYTEAGRPFDYKGAFYDLKGVSGEPVPVQSPRPLTISAASSPAGRAFAVATSDLLFATFADLDTGKAALKTIADQCATAGRRESLGICTAAHVVCRETDAEAEAYYTHYAETNMDAAAVDFHIGMTRANRVVDTYELENRVRRAAGLSSYRLVGTPERIADQLVAIHRAGFAGTTLSFVNFKTELPFFIERVMPLLRQAGLVA